MLKHLTILTKAWWPYFVAILGVIIVLAVNPFSDHHSFLNLEPYPDGLFYVIPAWRVTQGESFAVQRPVGQVIKARVMPLYSVVLIPSLSIWHHPGMVYVTNLLLCIISVIGIGQLSSRLKASPFTQAMVMMLYLCNAVVVWLPSLPMAENLGLALFVWSLVGASAMPHHKMQLSVTAILIGLLVLTKHIFIGPAVLLALYVVFKTWRSKQRELLVLLFAWWLVLGIMFALYMYWLAQPPLMTLQYLRESGVSFTFYSVSFVIPQIIGYLKLIVGFPVTLLWQKVSILHMGYVILAGWGIYQARRSPALFEIQLVLVAVLIAQLPLLVIFYTFDARYLILAIPILVTLAGIALQRLKKHWQLAMVLLLVFSLCVCQRSLWREVISSNIFNRSQAWQYEAVRALDLRLQAENDVVLISSLPPYLFDIYSTTRYRLLPLSVHQEFLEKGYDAWGIPATTKDLTELYTAELLRGNKLYVTTAYMTAESTFSADFSSLKDNFELSQIADDCMGTCALYRLQLK